MNTLAYYVYIENFNKKSIDKYNVLSEHILEQIKTRTKDIDTKQAFADEVRSVLLYHYWSKCEWEVIITDWPTHISIEEVERLYKELREYDEKWGHKPYSLGVNLKVAEKIDVYDQIMLNWEIFIDYLWKGLGYAETVSN